MEIKGVRFDWLLSSNMRYAIGRDNHLSPRTFVSEAKILIPQLDEENTKQVIYLLIMDLERELEYPMFSSSSREWEYKQVWVDFLKYLKELRGDLV